MEEPLTREIIGAAVLVHKELGPGLLESAYEECLVVEVKAVERMIPVHEAQLLTYLRLARKSVGLLMNFHVPRLKDGIVRRVL